MKEVQQVQATIEQLEKKVELMEEWQKLLANPLFNTLVTKDYLGDDAVRLTMNLKPKTEDNEIVSNMLLAKSTFSRYVGHILEEGTNALYSIEENKALQDELDSEV